jgi:tight adherence protein B
VTGVLAALAVGAGLAVVCVAVLMRARERVAEIAAILDLPFGEQDVQQKEKAASLLPFIEPGIQMTNRALERLNVLERVRSELARARIPLRPGEYVLLTVGASFVGGLLTWLISGQIIVALLVSVILVWASWRVVVVGKVERRRKAFEAQMPEALSLIASSLEAGHTFQHSIQMMV